MKSHDFYFDFDLVWEGINVFYEVHLLSSVSLKSGWRFQLNFFGLVRNLESYFSLDNIGFPSSQLGLQNAAGFPISSLLSFPFPPSAIHHLLFSANS